MDRVWSLGSVRWRPDPVRRRSAGGQQGEGGCQFGGGALEEAGRLPCPGLASGLEVGIDEVGDEFEPARTGLGCGPGQALGGQARALPVPDGQGLVNLFDPVGKHELECADEVVELPRLDRPHALLKPVAVQDECRADAGPVPVGSLVGSGTVLAVPARAGSGVTCRKETKCPRGWLCVETHDVPLYLAARSARRAGRVRSSCVWDGRDDVGSTGQRRSAVGYLAASAPVAMAPLYECAPGRTRVLATRKPSSHHLHHWPHPYRVRSGHGSTAAKYPAALSGTRGGP